MARATLKSAVERVLTKRSLVILDSLNNIKVGPKGVLQRHQWLRTHWRSRQRAHAC
jgi:hypothetical protein